MTDLAHWDSLDDGKYRDEAAVIADLLAAQPLSSEDRAAVRAEAEALVRGARRSVRKQGVVESFLQEFSLGTREGLALMCLAEALLRTPDDDTRDKLIAEKIGSADWASHLGGSDSLFVNASTWGLMLTGKLISLAEETQQNFLGAIKRLVARSGDTALIPLLGQVAALVCEQGGALSHIAIVARQLGVPAIMAAVLRPLTTSSSASPTFQNQTPPPLYSA